MPLPTYECMRCEHKWHPRSDRRPDEKVVQSDRKLYWYDVDCPKCGKNNESVIG